MPVTRSNIKVSIITVSFNSGATIEATLRSVAAQVYSNIEHIVIDGASTDRTLEIVHGYRDGLAGVISEPDRGVYDAMNKGLSVATGDVVGFLNSDDVFSSPHVVSKIAAAFNDHSVDACFGDLIYVDDAASTRVVRYWKSGPYRHGLCRGGWMPAHPTFYARRAVYERFGGFDLSFPRQADFELTTRLLEIHGIRTVYIPEILVRMRVGGISNATLSGIMKGNVEAYRACHKNGIAVTWLFVLRKMISRVPQFFARPSPDLLAGPRPRP